MCAFVRRTKLNTHMHPAWKAHIALRLNNVILKHIQMNAFKRWTTTCNSDVFSCDSHKFSLTLVRVFFGFCMLNYARFCYANEWAIWACSWHVSVCVCVCGVYVCLCFRMLLWMLWSECHLAFRLNFVHRHKMMYYSHCTFKYINRCDFVFLFVCPYFLVMIVWIPRHSCVVYYCC